MKILLSTGHGSEFSAYLRREEQLFCCTYQPFIDWLLEAGEDCIPIPEPLTEQFKKDYLAKFGEEWSEYGGWPNLVLDVTEPGYISEYDGAESWVPLSSLNIINPK